MRRALLLLPLLAGCAVRDTGTLPPPPVAATFPFAPPAATPATPAARDIAWDRFFTDPRLQRLIALSLDNNRDLAAAVARIAEARAQAGLARAGRFPTLRAGATLRLGDRAGGGGTGGTGESGGTVNPQPGAGDDFDGGTGGAGGGGRYNLQLSLAAYELDFWGRIAALDAAARANYLGRLEAARAFRVSLIRDVAESYIAERDLDERIALAEAALRARREALRLANLRADAGEATRIDLRQSELLVTQAATALAVLRRARAENANLLALLVGAPIPPGLPPPRPLATLALPALSPGLPSEVLLARPDVASAEADLRARGADLAAARAAFLPRVTLTGSAGFASQSLGDLFNGFLWSFVPSLLQPIFDGGRNRANRDIAEARQDIAVATYERSIQVAFREVADALAARRFLADRFAAEQQAVAAQEERARLSRRRYEEGVSSFLEVLDAERELFTARQALLEARRDQLIAAARLYAALGGGTEA